eukprot:COSAG02_NODE_30_length_50867_cov_66.594331_35_plen_94_part_00
MNSALAEFLRITQDPGTVQYSSPNVSSVSCRRTLYILAPNDEGQTTPTLAVRHHVVVYQRQDEFHRTVLLSGIYTVSSCRLCSPPGTPQGRLF